MNKIAIVSVNELQRQVLGYLIDHDRISCNEAGDCLASAKLLKTTSVMCSNFCLPGSAVLRSLEKVGFVFQFRHNEDGWTRKLYSLTRRGRTLAEHLRKDVGNKR